MHFALATCVTVLNIQPLLDIRKLILKNNPVTWEAFVPVHVNPLVQAIPYVSNKPNLLHLKQCFM